MLVTLDSSLRKPLYVQIRDQIRDRILNGGLKPGRPFGAQPRTSPIIWECIGPRWATPMLNLNPKA